MPPRPVLLNAAEMRMLRKSRPAKPTARVGGQPHYLAAATPAQLKRVKAASGRRTGVKVVVAAKKAGARKRTLRAFPPVEKDTARPSRAVAPRAPFETEEERQARAGRDVRQAMAHVRRELEALLAQHLPPPAAPAPRRLVPYVPLAVRAARARGPAGNRRPAA
jgi:hypothetical protein